MTTAQRGSTIVSCLMGAGLLMYPLLGSPNYGYFEFMKIAVCGCALFVVWALFKMRPKLVPLCVALGALGLLEMFGKMRRTDWVPWNWATIAAFAIAGVVTVVEIKPRKTLEELEAEIAEVEANIERMEAEDLHKRAEAAFEVMKAEAAVRRAAGEFDGRDFEAERAALGEELRRSFANPENEDRPRLPDEPRT